jgi:hypothetical protein
MSVIASKSFSFCIHFYIHFIDIYLSFFLSFCGLCLQETFRGKTRKKDSHNHVMICHENVHFHNDYYVPEFYPQYCQHRRFAEIWNDMIASDVVSPAIIQKLREKLAPMIQDTNLIFEQDNSGFVNIIFTKEQENQLRTAPPPPPPAAPPLIRAGEDEPIVFEEIENPPQFFINRDNIVVEEIENPPHLLINRDNIINAPLQRRRRVYLCSICRQEGHNRIRCPMRVHFDNNLAV